MEKHSESVHVSEEEEEMIDGLFLQCDVHNEGTVQVQTVIQFLTNCLGNENNEADLLKLKDILEAVSLDGTIDLSSYRDGVKHWILEIKSRCTFMEGETVFEQSSLREELNVADDSIGRTQYSIEASGVCDGSILIEHDPGELMTQIEGLKFANHKLTEENSALYRQLEGQEESSSSLATELTSQRHEADTLRKKIKSLQELTDQQKAVMEENEELKSRLATVQQGKRELDRQLTHEREERSRLEHMAKHAETMCQKAQSQLDQAQKQIQNLNTSYTQHKLHTTESNVQIVELLSYGQLLLCIQMLFQTQEGKASMTEKEKEIADLAAKLKEALSQNEKLQEGKDEVETRLTRVNSKYLRVQSKVEQLGLNDVSLTEDDQINVDFSQRSPKVQFSTPCTRNSICMELMDRLNEDKHLASPLCEMIEQSAEWPLYHRSAVLPQYVSTWEFDLANGSLQEYSNAMMKSRKSLSPDFFDRDVERRLLSLKGTGSLQKELIKQYRVNLDLAEKCHKAELRENELHEKMTATDRQKQEDSLRCQQLEESLVSIKVAQEGDLKDLWRLVHSTQEDSADSEKSELSISTEQLKLKIRQEIEALRRRLGKQAGTKAVEYSDRPPRVLYYNCKGRSCSSPLVDALNIETVNIINTDKPVRHADGQSSCSDCQKHSSNHPSNRSVPVPRRHHRVHGDPGALHGCNTIETADGQCGWKGPDGFVSNQERNLPVRFTFDRSDLGSFMSEDRDTPIAYPLYDSGMSRDNSEQGHLFRRSSYLKAIENKGKAAEDVNGSRCRRDSFQSAIEQGQISPTGPPQANTTPCSVGDTTPDNESEEFLVCKGTPRYSSTPCPLPKPVLKSVNFHPNTYSKDSASLQNGDSDSMKGQGEPVFVSQKAEIPKASGVFANKSSVSSFHNLSVLHEEDGSCTDSSRCESGPSSSYQDSSASSGQQEDMSMEVWTLSGTGSDHSNSGSHHSNSCSSRDSGHSSSISCFDSDNPLDLKDFKETEVISEQSRQQTTSSISETDCLTAESNLSILKEVVDTNSAETVKPSEASASSESRTSVLKPLNSRVFSVDSARDLAPSERILLMFGDRWTNNQTYPLSRFSPLKHFPGNVTVGETETRSGGDDKLIVQESVSPVSSTALEVDPAATEPEKKDEDRGISFVSKGAWPEMKGPTRELDKSRLMFPSKKVAAAHTNGGREGQTIIMEEELEHSGHGDGHGDGPKPESNLAKIRQSHLAKRRDHVRQNKMPQLSELSESSEEKQLGPPAIPKITTEGEEDSHMTNGDAVMPSLPDAFLKKLGLLAEEESSEELSEQEIESKFSSLSLAFKTDAQTLEKRLEIQERSRDIAEQNVDRELQGLRNGLATLNQICTDPQVREVLAKIQNHIEILEKSTARVSSRAEVYGAIQQEKRMSRAMDIMVQHVENISRVHEREHAELEEARKLLQDSRSLGPSSLDIAGGDMLSRRSASVCQNNMFGGKASKRRVSEVALPKVLGGSGAPTLHPSASMGHVASIHYDPPESTISRNNDKDARSRFQAAVASTTVKSAVTNTLRRTSLEKQNHVPSVSPAPTPPQMSRDNSADSTSKSVDAQDKEKQKSLEEEAYKKGFEQGLRATLGKDLTHLREQQNHINESLGEIMDSIDNQMEEPKSLKQIMAERYHESVPKFQISGWRIRMTMGVFFVILAFISVIISLFPVSSAEHLEYVNVDGPLL